MADAIYHFVWGTFCDWYVELIKGAFDDETSAVAAWAFDQILVMLHPLMPFITEELWNAMGERPYDLIVAKWPEPEAKVDPQAKAEIEWLIALAVIAEARTMRAELNIPWSAMLVPHVLGIPRLLSERLSGESRRSREWRSLLHRWRRTACRPIVQLRSSSTGRPIAFPLGDRD